MRAPKAQLYGAQPPVRAPKAQSYGTRHSLHDRAGTFASTIIKLKSRPSFFWLSGSPLWMQGSASNLIQMKHPSSGNTKFGFKRS